jgi:hypothetical protein
MIAPPPSALPLPLRTPRIITRAPVAVAVSNGPRFTLDGSDDLEQHLARTCAKIAAGIRGLIPRRKLHAVLLGGGYGRGQGGVLRTAGGDRPYNDLEFYVLLHGNRHLNQKRFGRALHVLGEILTPQAGVEVEFKITSRAEIARGRVSMFSYDLLMGHRWLIGDERVLEACSDHRDAAKIPLSEATRLLMNRCSGLLFARELLEHREFTAANSDFVRRNMAKAQLALGDAVLVAHRQYHCDARERHDRLQELVPDDTMPWYAEARRHHAMGVEFKLHPERSTASREQLAADHANVTALAGAIWLWLEQRRICAPFRSPRAYAMSELNKCRETSPSRNVLVNLRALGMRPWTENRATRHPRERILNAMTLLLWEPATLGSPHLLHCVQRELQSNATTFADLMCAYRELWAKVN